ncbi:MAG: hypothetical protein ACRCWY_04065, partial [Cellulosilyticaceae bacterium]
MISKIKKWMKVVGISVIIASIIYGMVGYMFLDVTKGFLAIIGFGMGLLGGIVGVGLALGGIYQLRNSVKEALIILAVSGIILWQYGGYVLDVGYMAFNGPKVYEGYCSLSSEKKVEYTGRHTYAHPIEYRIYTLALENQADIRAPRRTKLYGHGGYRVVYAPFSEHLFGV